jgi:predicted transcriptional regulator
MAQIELPAEHRALIAGCMRQLGFTQAALAKQLKISQGKLSEKLAGKLPFEDSELGALVEMLQIESLLEVYPELISGEERRERRLAAIMEVVGESFAHLSPQDIKEVLLGLAMLLESKPPYGQTPRTKRLRGLALLRLDSLTRDVLQGTMLYTVPAFVAEITDLAGELVPLM